MNNLLYLTSAVLVYGLFLTYEWAVLDVAVGRFGHPRGPFWFMGRFGIDPFVSVMVCGRYCRNPVSLVSRTSCTRLVSSWYRTCNRSFNENRLAGLLVVLAGYKY